MPGNSLAELKKELRQQAKQTRNNLSKEYRDYADTKIRENILSSREYIEAKLVFSFVSIGKEINTRPLLEKVLGDNKVLLVPLVIAPGIMEARRIKSLSDLSLSEKGLWEPDFSSKVYSLEEIDLSLIPALSADLQGNRLGYGSGYYDRFFQDFDIFVKQRNIQAEAFIVCREKEISSWLPTDEKDQSFSNLISEKGRYYF